MRAANSSQLESFLLRLTLKQVCANDPGGRQILKQPSRQAKRAQFSAARRDKSQWSQQVTQTSHALALERGVFTWDDPKRIALSLSRSAEESTHRKADPFRSAMSMLVFYINRAGRRLDRRQRQILERAKQELRVLYGKA